MLRAARGLAAASVALFIGAFSHVVAGGGAPAGAGLAVSAAFAAMVCVVLTRSRPSLPLLVIAVASSQFVFHLLFAVGDGAGSGLTVATVQHGPHVVTALVPDAGGAVAAHAHGAGSLHDSGAMWVAHAVAALVTIAALRHGEAVLCRLVVLGRQRLAPAASAVGARLVRLAAAIARLAVLAGRALPTPTERWVTASWLVSSALRDLGAVFERLRFRGPPALAALRPIFRSTSSTSSVV
jgi:hypothetical protein